MNTNVKTFDMQFEFARRFPDPIRGIEHHVWLCKASSIPKGIPLDPNPRNQNPQRAIYKAVSMSLKDPNDLTFHLKNKGITMIADQVSLDKDSKRAQVVFKNRDIREDNASYSEGIVDGGHTYRVITDASDSDEGVPDEQFVKIEILTGIYDVKSVDHVEIARGLNTSMQVTQMSINDLKDKFQWIKEELQSEPYKEQIYYRENDSGNVSAREIVALLYLFLSSDSEKHPTMAYAGKESCLSHFNDERNTANYQALRPILKNILQLHDHILASALDKYNEMGGRGRSTFLFQTRKRGAYELSFSGTTANNMLHSSAHYPILGAFRFLVDRDAEGLASWKDGFDSVISLCDEILGRMVRSAYNTGKNYGSLNVLGKDVSFWGYLYTIVGLRYHERQIDQK